MSKSKNPGYIAGDNWEVCDRCGQAFRAHAMKTQWDGLRVCKRDYEPRHPQDAVRSKPNEGEGASTGKTDDEPTYLTEVNTDYLTDIPEGTFN